jgi:endonuclease III related protein
MSSRNKYRLIFNVMYNKYGPQHWWPGETPFEIMLGAVLTQNTSWSNVEKAINTLKMNGALDPQTIADTKYEELAAWLTPVGYFNVKATRLQLYCSWYLDSGQFEQLNTCDTLELRKALLSVKGIGPETADDILLYAFTRPIFVIDAYTRRLFSRLGYIKGDEKYETLRTLFEKKLGQQADKIQLFNEYHGLIVHHAKYYCKTKPVCDECCLQKHCNFNRTRE